MSHHVITKLWPPHHPWVASGQFPNSIFRKIGNNEAVQNAPTADDDQKLIPPTGQGWHRHHRSRRGPTTVGVKSYNSHITFCMYDAKAHVLCYGEDGHGNECWQTAMMMEEKRQCFSYFNRVLSKRRKGFWNLYRTEIRSTDWENDGSYYYPRRLVRCLVKQGPPTNPIAKLAL